MPQPARSAHRCVSALHSSFTLHWPELSQASQSCCAVQMRPGVAVGALVHSGGRPASVLVVVVCGQAASDEAAARSGERTRLMAAPPRRRTGHVTSATTQMSPVPISVFDSSALSTPYS